MWGRGGAKIDETAVLDWSAEQLAEWVRPKWYEKLPIAILFAIATAWVWINLGAIRGLGMLTASLLWYIIIVDLIKSLKERILAGRIYRAAELRYRAKHALPRLFKKHPWMHEYLKACKRSEELGWPYVPDIIMADPAAKIEVRTPPPEDWTIPIMSMRDIAREEERDRIQEPLEPTEESPIEPREQPPPTPTQPSRETEREISARQTEEDIEVTGDEEDALRWLSQLLYILEPEEWAQLLGAILTNTDYSAKQLAETLGIHRTTMHHYISGRRRPSRTKIITTAPVLMKILTDIFIADKRTGQHTLIEILRSLAETATTRQEEIQHIIQHLITTGQTHPT